MAAAPKISIMRAYDDLEGARGARLLVDRLWPRGLKKEELKVDEWIRDAAPSTELRKWFGHDPRKWEEFRKRYLAELKDRPEAVARCLEWCRKGPVVLLYGAKDREHNQAVVLRDYLQSLLEGETKS